MEEASVSRPITYTSNLRASVGHAFRDAIHTLVYRVSARMPDVVRELLGSMYVRATSTLDLDLVYVLGFGVAICSVHLSRRTM